MRKTFALLLFAIGAFLFFGCASVPPTTANQQDFSDPLGIGNVPTPPVELAPNQKPEPINGENHSIHSIFVLITFLWSTPISLLYGNRRILYLNRNHQNYWNHWNHRDQTVLQTLFLHRMSRIVRRNFGKINLQFGWIQQINVM